MNVFDQIRAQFENESGLAGVNSEIVRNTRGEVLVLYVSSPTERLFGILEDIRRANLVDGELPLVTLKAKTRGNLLEGAEGHLFLRGLAETLNVNRFSFDLSRYTKSVSGAEAQIVSSANHVVLGRRGAGKSMLLLYAWHERQSHEKPCIWIDMQVYSGRADDQVVTDILSVIIEQSAPYLEDEKVRLDLQKRLRGTGLTVADVRRILPDVRRFLSGYAAKNRDLFVFLDDFHVIALSLQPILLDIIYAVSRANRIFVKVSAIETLVRTYDSVAKQGLEIPQDAQNIPLDYNLTAPDRATRHIESILDLHAQFAGMRSVRRLCTSGDVIPRLTWVSAGVPRDALNLFSQAMTTASHEGRQRVSVSNVNVAASKTLSIKLRELELDASEEADELKTLVEEIEEFCVTEHRSNAFLFEVSSNAARFTNLKRLVDLRLLHVISEGITVGKAGQKFLGLILDYGFYTGVRAAQSVELFNRQSEKVAYKDLRKLPIFK